MPANEEELAALEHLYMLGIPPHGTPVSGGETATAAHHDVEKTPHPASRRTAVPADMPACSGLQVGDVVLCTLPLSRRGQEDAAPRAALVVGNRSLSGRRYLDVAWGRPAGAEAIAPHELAVVGSCDPVAVALMDPTGFDRRRRFLIAEDEKTRVHRRLCTLSENIRKRVGETLLLAGDITPTPIGKAAAPKLARVVEHRARKAYSIPAVVNMS